MNRFIHKFIEWAINLLLPIISVMSLNLVGFDKHFAPTCVREHSYRYDSFDTKYETLKYTRPKECRDCPLANDGLCQKVYKVKITTDLRKYTAPARGSKAWKKIFKRRTAVERVNAYLKGYFQLNNVRYRTGKRAKVHFDLVTLVYNASKLAADRINAMLNQQTSCINFKYLKDPNSVGLYFF